MINRKMYLCNLKPEFVVFSRVNNSKVITIKFLDLINLEVKKWSCCEEVFNTFFNIAIENNKKKLAYPKLDLKPFFYFEKNNSIKIYTKEASLILSTEVKKSTKEDTLKFDKEKFLENYIIGENQVEINDAYMYQVAVQKKFHKIELNEKEKNILKKSDDSKAVFNESDKDSLLDPFKELLNMSQDNESDNENFGFDFAS